MSKVSLVGSKILFEVETAAVTLQDLRSTPVFDFAGSILSEEVLEDERTIKQELRDLLLKSVKMIDSIIGGE